MLHLNTKGVEVFISRYKNNHRDSYWENYELVLWDKNPNGFNSIKGLFRKDSWGISNRFQVNNEGIWVLPVRYVKHFK